MRWTFRRFFILQEKSPDGGRVLACLLSGLLFSVENRNTGTLLSVAAQENWARPARKCPDAALKQRIRFRLEEEGNSEAPKKQIRERDWPASYILPFTLPFNNLFLSLIWVVLPFWRKISKIQGNDSFTWKVSRKFSQDRKDGLTYILHRNTKINRKAKRGSTFKT